MDLYVHTGAGRYICGEETALINSLEGRRANPRAKPPFPQIAGPGASPPSSTTWKPCATFPPSSCAVPTGSRGCRRQVPDAGTKLYGVSGRAKRTGVWELPIGTTARELLEVHAGGMQDGLT
jgi:NADH-quinone oxidoreductase subunit F